MPPRQRYLLYRQRYLPYRQQYCPVRIYKQAKIRLDCTPLIHKLYTFEVASIATLIYGDVPPSPRQDNLTRPSNSSSSAASTHRSCQRTGRSRKRVESHGICLVTGVVSSRVCVCGICAWLYVCVRVCMCVSYKTCVCLRVRVETTLKPGQAARQHVSTLPDDTQS